MAVICLTLLYLSLPGRTLVIATAWFLLAESVATFDRGETTRVKEMHVLLHVIAGGRFLERLLETLSRCVYSCIKQMTSVAFNKERYNGARAWAKSSMWSRDLECLLKVILCIEKGWFLAFPRFPYTHTHTHKFIALMRNEGRPHHMLLYVKLLCNLGKTVKIWIISLKVKSHRTGCVFLGETRGKQFSDFKIINIINEIKYKAWVVNLQWCLDLYSFIYIFPLIVFVEFT